MCFFVILLCQDCGEHFFSVPTGVEGGRERELECESMSVCMERERERERGQSGWEREKFHTELQTKQLLF